MNLAPIEAIVKAVLYEGYLLYPYRASNVKNRQRWTFGGVYPRDYAHQDGSCASGVQTECLVRGSLETDIEVHVRFLHLVRREVGEFGSPMAELPADLEPAYSEVPWLKVNEEVFQNWEEAIERDVTASSRMLRLVDGPPLKVPFGFSGQRSSTPLWGADGRLYGLLIHVSSDLRGELTIAAKDVAPGVFRLSVCVDNVTPTRGTDSNEQAERHWRAFASTHTILGVCGGSFVSLLDPGDLADAATACNNRGTWPVLAGEVGRADTVLSSPIILYDYPQVAPESPGDLFDATEIDEILTLRILAMTDEEKREMRALDRRARALLERTQELTFADMERLHGAARKSHFHEGLQTGALGSDPPRPLEPELLFQSSGGGDLELPALEQKVVCENAALLSDSSRSKRVLAVGDRVHLRPKGRADIFDLVLQNEVAVIEAIERDFDNRIHVAVVLEADPGRELGLDRMPGHRFFFSPDEIEPIGKNDGT